MTPARHACHFERSEDLFGIPRLLHDESWLNPNAAQFDGTTPTSVMLDSVVLGVRFILS